jgi:hypothetical protein
LSRCGCRRRHHRPETIRYDHGRYRTAGGGRCYIPGRDVDPAVSTAIARRWRIPTLSTGAAHTPRRADPPVRRGRDHQPHRPEPFAPAELDATPTGPIWEIPHRRDPARSNPAGARSIRPARVVPFPPADRADRAGSGTEGLEMLGGIFPAPNQLKALSDALAGSWTVSTAERPMTTRRPPGSSPAWAVPTHTPASIVRRDPRPRLPRPWLRF